ncbi:conserved hypothetical protein [Pectobacterium parmentieri WPP163]|uniref:hypothetical protein n=1 Tax=Pectobacterium parmentieri TaxID=1905730 RepID=UPI0001B0E8C5|nr:hypothetical protein [Pectobacterium parmentieri]ACX87489.1 conserved hypothetical protein [Pectobacterium parmentieri WPP163]
MDQDWILQKKETRRMFSKSTWVPLRAAVENEHGNVKNLGYSNEFFGCGSVAFSPENREIAEKLSWGDIGLSRTIGPYAYEDGFYTTIDEYQYNDKETVGVHLVLEMPLPVVGGRQWILSPDLVAALRLIKEGNNWVRPQENFVIVAREILDEKGEQRLIEIKREYLLDYLAARNLALRLSYYRQRVENVTSVETSHYAGLESHQEERDGGRYELRICEINDIFGGSWAMFRAWRTDVDEEEDAPVMGPETNENTDYESSQGYKGGYEGVRIEGEFWRDEWIDHQGISTRVRGDADQNLPQFIVETDGTRLASAKLNNEDVGRWLWFRPGIVNELLDLRGFSLGWYTAETGSIKSTSGYSIHFGVNSSDLITIYAYDITRLPAWEQHIWAAQNIVPDGKVSSELLDSQVKAKPASTKAVEVLFFEAIAMLENGYREAFDVPLFTHDINPLEAMKHISRFASKDQASLLRLAKELVRIFSDRLDMRELRKLSTHSNKDKFGSNKLLEDVLAQKVGPEKARKVFGPIAGAYDMRVGDAHPTSSKIGDALKLAGIDESSSFLRQGEQLISNFGQSIWWIGKLLFEKP